MRLLVLAVGLVPLALGVLLLIHSAQTAYQFHWRLGRGDAVEVGARAEGFRTSEPSRGSGLQYHVRYVFRVPGDDTDYVFSDDIRFLPDGDGSVDVPQEVWDRSRESGEITVEYLEGDPTVNQPVEARRGIGTVVLFGALGLLMLFPGALLVFGSLRGRRRRRQATEGLPSPIS